MKFTLLGTGTSQGIPVIGCECEVCTSPDFRDSRLRCSALIRSESNSILIDAGPDFRQQALRADLDGLDAVLITHEHNDHMIGLDDLRPLIFRNGKPMQIFAEERVLNEIHKRFSYAFEFHQYPGAPSFELIEITPGQKLSFGSINIEVIRVQHGPLPILGFIVQDQLAYLTDTNGLDTRTVERLRGIEILILDALRKKSHHSHNSLNEAIGMAASINASKTFFIHLSHLMGPTFEWEKILPPTVFPAYDMLSFELDSE